MGVKHFDGVWEQGAEESIWGRKMEEITRNWRNVQQILFGQSKEGW
jgi:hypothetical protein